ncbi:MAG: hypothetical protein CTY16_08965 [Methylobacter sp.]|nr:MAG: hypothetical protein CTY16_08965 [Methylobacter sp.]
MLNSLVFLLLVTDTRDLHEHFNDGSIVQYIEENEDVPDDIYFQYDELGITREPFPFYRVKKFLNGLLVSNPRYVSELTDIYPCYPKSPFDDGEWEVFMTDGTRALSFKHLMEYLYLDTIIRWREKVGYWRQ